MARALTAEVLAETQAKQLSPILLFQGTFTTGTVYLWTGVGNLEWDGNTYQGIGLLGGISEIEETEETKATGIRVSLSGIPSSMISLALSECRQGKPVRVWIGFLNASGVLIASPYLLFAGRLDVPEISDSGDTATLSISVESRMVDLRKARNRRWTDEDQRLDYPDDLGFEYVNSIQDIELKWGTDG